MLFVPVVNPLRIKLTLHGLPQAVQINTDATLNSHPALVPLAFEESIISTNTSQRGEQELP